jgi:hypothetical protein
MEQPDNWFGASIHKLEGNIHPPPSSNVPGGPTGYSSELSQCLRLSFLLCFMINKALKQEGDSKIV